MYKRNLISATGAILVLGLIACNGGGGDNSNDISNMEGTWTGALTKTSDSCSNSHSQTINFIHKVKQNENAISLSETNSINYIGVTSGSSGFDVSGLQSETSDSKTCALVQVINYNHVDSDNDNTATVDFKINQTCGSLNSCSVSYTGTASRVGVVDDSASPTASSTPAVVVAGGCAAINEHPAAGTYSGSGDCGISDAAYQSSSQGTENVVVLSPFGQNGATSFTFSSAASSTATSRRSDLNIKGVVGYSCTITCSPPSTFTVSCFKEGGTTCIEKF